MIGNWVCFLKIMKYQTHKQVSNLKSSVYLMFRFFTIFLIIQETGQIMSLHNISVEKDYWIFCLFRIGFSRLSKYSVSKNKMKFFKMQQLNFLVLHTSLSNQFINGCNFSDNVFQHFIDCGFINGHNAGCCDFKIKSPKIASLKYSNY